MSSKQTDAIKRALSRYRQTSANEHFQQDADVALLARAAKIPGVPSLERKKALVHQALGECDKATIDHESFAQALATKAEEFASSATQDWHLVFPVNIPSNAWRGRRSFTVVETRFTRKSPLWKRLDFKAWHEEIELRYLRDEVIFGVGFSLLLATIRARDEVEAFRIGESRYVLLLAAFNVRHSFHRVRSFSGGRPPPIAKVPSAPNFGTFREDGTFKSVFFRDDRPEQYSAFRPQIEDFKNVNRLLRYFKRVEGRSSTGRLVTHAFSRYQEAIDRARPSDAFLNLWQILDTIAYPDSLDNEATEYSIATVSKRIQSLFRDDRVRELVNYTRHLRNRLVHTGVFDGDAMDVEFLKAIVEMSLDQLMDLEEACPTGASITTFYENVSSPSEVVASKAAALAEVSRVHRRLARRRK